jgi:hypothetical protein
MLRAEGTNPVPEHIFDHPYFQVHTFLHYILYLISCHFSPSRPLKCF